MKTAHRSVRLGTGVVVAVMLVVACSSTSQKAQHASTTTTVNKVPVTTTTTQSAAGLTAEQMDAHEGVGVPKGWDPVDAGNARVWVPKDWILLSQGACIGNTSAAGMISIGSLPNTACDSLLPSNPKQAVALIPSSQASTGRPALTVHGYRIYNVSTYTPVWNFYVVPQLGLRIATHGTLSSRILNTLAPSARKVALALSNAAVPSNWHAVTKNDVALSIPPSWTVATPNFFCASPVSDSTLLVIKPDIGVAPCPAPPPTPAGALHDGVSVYVPPHNRYAPSPTGKPITTVQQRATTVAVYAESGDQNALDLSVRRAGSKITHTLTLGLGRDGRIAAGVLSSIQATT